jgi:tRNA-2-methylthio-N6-dimethylallyladenosine synthase
MGHPSQKTTQKVFAPLITETKYIDETRQGQAYEAAMPAIGEVLTTPTKQAYIETYGCQMNFSDTEIVASVLTEMGYGFTRDEQAADLVLLNTCSIRHKAEEKVFERLHSLRRAKAHRPGLMIGVLGCMAERMKHQLLEEEQLVDLVVGPDAYRSLPTLLETVETGQKAVNVLLSREETYADVAPVRLNTNGVSAFISITRGCNNMCTFCVVPFTRGRERSRPADSIVQEARQLAEQGYREVTLLGQNVDSYRFEDVSFAELLGRVAQIDPGLRVRFSTSHPKDMTDEVFETLARYPNVCNYIHLPVQSGSTRILDLMRRNHTREWYLDRISQMRQIVPNIGLSTDIISGFCTETEQDHQDTLDLMRQVGFDFAYMFAYSERPGTLAARQMADDVPEEVKKRRLSEIIALQNDISHQRNQAEVGRVHTVLVEGDSRRSDADWAGRADNNKMVVFAKAAPGQPGSELGPGHYAQVRISRATSATLIGERV